MKMNRVRSVLVAACLASMALGPWSEAHAALNAYLKVKGQTQGDIKGSVTKKGHADEIAVIAVSHEIISPRDPASGLPTGQRMHKPFVFTKELDRSTPLLYQALANAERLSEVELAVFAPDDKVAATPIYKVKLRDASISGIRMFMQVEGKTTRPVMEISVTYRKIEWTWTEGGIMAMDDWESPVAAGAPKPRTKPGAKGKG